MPGTVRTLRVVILGFLATTAVLYFPFTAEDAFITYRYAANLATSGAFVFNAGEPILALTSPLHGLLSALLFLATDDLAVANKILGLALLAVVGAALWARYREWPRVQLLVVTLALLPPCVLMWMFGGLETPILLFLVTSMVLLTEGEETLGLGRLCSVALLAGLAFVTRFDSVLFTLPIVLHVLWRSRSLRHAAVATALGAVLPVVWIAASVANYGDPLPTSYYSKTPQHGVPVLIGNGKYVVAWLVFVGVAPAAAVVAALPGRAGLAVDTILRHLKRCWWLYAAIGAQLVYGLTMATTHMMFSFRFFVPYLPAAAILLGDLARRALEVPGDAAAVRRRDRLLTGTIVGLVLFQAVQAVHTYEVSVNGLSPSGEYLAEGLSGYTDFIETLRTQGEDIRRHWESLEDRPNRLPRIYTFAGGVVPYTFRESYVYETLVSWRHCEGAASLVEAPNVWMRTEIDLRRSADYIHVIVPRHGELAPQIPLPEDHYSLISSRPLEFDGQPERFMVLYNPTPEPHALAARIDGGCGGRTGEGTSGRTGSTRDVEVR